MASGCLSLPKTPDVAGVDRFRGRDLLHQPVAARGRRLLRQAGGRHRHGVVGHPVDPAHRPAGGRAHRVPAHAELLAARPQRAGVRREEGGVRRRSGRVPRGGAAGRAPACPWSRSMVRTFAGVRSGAPGRVRGGLRVRRSPRPRQRLRRHRREPRGQRDRVRVPARQDPLDRARSRRRRRRSARRTTSTAPSARASTPTTSRPTTCRTSAWSTCARIRIRTITETGIDTASRSFAFDAIVFATGFDAMTGAIVAVDIRGRDGLALADKWADGPEDLPRPDDDGLPELLHHHRAGEPVGAVEHGGVDRAARRLGGRLPRPHARAAPGRDRADAGGRGGVGAARQRLRRHHALPARELLVHGRERSGQAARVPALRRRRRSLPQGLRRGGAPRLSRLRLRRPGRRALQRRRRLPAAAGRRDGARADRGARAAAARDPVGRGRARALGGHGGRAAARSRGGRGRRRRRCPARPARWRTASTGRRARVRIRSSSTSTAAAGCSAATTPTTRSAATSACAPTRSSCRSTTAMRPRRASPPRSTTGSPRCAGSRPTPQRWAASRASSRCAAGAPAATSPPSSARWRATPAGRASPVRCW